MEERTKVELEKRVNALALKQKMAASGLLSREEIAQLEEGQGGLGKKSKHGCQAPHVVHRRGSTKIKFSLHLPASSKFATQAALFFLETFVKHGGTRHKSTVGTNIA